MMETRVTELGPAGRRHLMSVIGEAPETLMSLEQLRRGLCRAYVLGLPEDPVAAAVLPSAFPGDVSLYGNDAQATFALLHHVDGWEAADIPAEQARAVANWLGWATRRPVTFSREHFFTLEHPVQMLLAVVLAQMGFSAAKRGKDDRTRFVRGAIFYTLAVILILVAIPWPGSEQGRPLFRLPF